MLGAGGFLTSSPGDHYSLRRAKPDEGSRKGKRPCFAGRQILHVTKNSPSAIVLVWSLVLAMYAEARAQESAGDPSVMCERAALQAERDWRLPQGLLAAIGLAESGRRIQAGTYPVIWPWTINAEGQGYYQPSKAAAVARVRALQLRGVRLIDVGCFQVDLFFHPSAFAGLEEAFDPDANARAAARILSQGRFGSAGWDRAIAAYHSAVPPIGLAYLQKIRAVWPWTAAHSSRSAPEPIEAYAPLLSTQAWLVRVVTPFEVAPGHSTISSSTVPENRRTGAVIQWLLEPPAKLPVVLTPELQGTRRISKSVGYSR